MVSIALDPAYRRVSVEEFINMDFGGAKAELDDGIIFMMAGGTRQHSRIAGRLIRHLGNALDGSGCEPFGSDFGVRTREQTVRYPDISIFCGSVDEPERNGDRVGSDPRVIVEVLSPSTATHDLNTKLLEYKALPSVQEIVFVDPASGSVCFVRRGFGQDWGEHWLSAQEDLVFASINATVRRSELGLGSE